MAAPTDRSGNGERARVGDGSTGRGAPAAPRAPLCGLGLALGAALLAAAATAACGTDEVRGEPPLRQEVEQLVRLHAAAWEAGDSALLAPALHLEARFAYPRRRVDRETWLAELDTFGRTHEDTRIYIHRIVVDGAEFAVEWQFATTERASGIRTAVSDAIIGRVEDGKIVLWKEYLDGRVIRLQKEGSLPLEEGEEPFPWPRAP